MKAILLFSLVLMLSVGNAAEVRVRNNSDTDFTSVVVGKIKYGDIKRGTTTSYQFWPDEVYNIERCTLFANTVPLKFQPRDYNGEGPLPKTGKFTYVLTIVNGQLSIRAEDDLIDSNRK
ncbi:MAG: hypothetical protein V4495_29140 [Pseudomonadota bacterium]